jgi:hypothetical protein
MDEPVLKVSQPSLIFVTIAAFQTDLTVVSMTVVYLCFSKLVYYLYPTEPFRDSLQVIPLSFVTRF